MPRRQRAHRLAVLPIALLIVGVVVISDDKRGLLKFDPSSISRFATVDKQVLVTNTTQEESVGLVDYCVGDSYATLKRLVAYNRRVYADQWGYKLLSGSEEELPVQTFIEPRAWLKAAYFFQLLSSASEQDIQWFVWIDCDALVTRFDWSVSHVLEDLGVASEHHVVVAQDPHTDFNTGVMFVRNSEWSRELWKRTLQKAADPEIRTHSWWEQQALLELYRENEHDESKHILIVSDRWKMNAFETARRDEFNASSFILHRVNCREQPKCDNLFESFFCKTMPNGTYPTELVSCNKTTDAAT